MEQPRLLTYDPAKPTVKARKNVPAKLNDLYLEAQNAIDRLNRALAVSSAKSIVAAGLGPRLLAQFPESAQPVLAVPTKPIAERRTSGLGPSKIELIQTARRLGMTEARIAERFGAAAAKIAETAKPEAARNGKPLTLKDLGLA